MSERSGLAKKFRVYLVVQALLVVALVVYLALGRHQTVGDEFGFTVIAAGLMALLSYWTLNTTRKVLELAVSRMLQR
ncbi:hypothetical protein [Marinobacter sp. X15-166B]|uniref:hypothetical protein n=1 Tax=Marinobacter sp. X15-166B TaxID=1897620 RepID=UPI00085BE7E8|nr:hypothetical protein [Marinobacter sp. X15-166B]OEY66188.1 hypothetical protein BG841_06765 [Marinobacter sp. X15-166B]